MDQRHLVTASSLAVQYGVKMIAYGPPGTGKTPVAQTAPSPLMLVCEPGMMTMRGVNIPCYYAPTRDKIKEFFEWFFKSAEARQFHTLCIDSGSELCEIVLKHWLNTVAHGMKAYGEMASECIDWFDQLYFLKEKHVYIICKQQVIETVTQGFAPTGAPIIKTSRKAAPYFPGKEVPMKVSHKYDLVAQTNRGDVPGVQGRQLYFKCVDDDDTTARDRSGFLTQYEELNLTKLFAKAMQ